MNELLFTPAALLDLLLQVNELKGYDIGVSEDYSGSIQLSIGDSKYSISSNAVDIPVEQETISDVSDVNMETYEALSEQGEIDLDTIESGILKEVAKTLMVGGLVRLTTKLLK